jgi:hypothetical protein
MDLFSCIRCGNSYPKTAEFFIVDKRNKDGLQGVCRKCDLKRNAIYRDNNRTKWNESSRNYYEQNKEKCQETRKRWNKENRGICTLTTQQYRAKARSLPNTLTIDEWEENKSHFDNKCAYCGKDSKLHQEHFVALSKGGELTNKNIIPSCKSCNSSKSSKPFSEWYPGYKHYDATREQIILSFITE